MIQDVSNPGWKVEPLVETFPLPLHNTLNSFYKQRRSKRLVCGFLNFDSRCLVLLLR